MAHYSPLAWLITSLLLLGQGLFFYAIFRYVALGRLRINPFQKGWRYLYERYGTSTGPALLDLTSVVVGSASYQNGMYVAFADTGVFLRENLFAKGFLLLPYQDFIVVAPPKRVTILLFPLTTAGLFKIAGVEISFAELPAKELITRLSLANQTRLP
ncbi:MAG: hypothetical protein EOO62_25810 [Hymenobacter sp.]|nr:MAG: hypothetical protein EOO62_25810 [Hymenobacter sp.]